MPWRALARRPRRAQRAVSKPRPALRPGESRLTGNDRDRADETVTFAHPGLEKSRLIRVVAQDEADLSNGSVDVLLGV